MATGVFSVALAIGAALISVWLDMRLDEKRPGAPASRLGHAAAAYLVLQLVVAGTGSLDHPPAFAKLCAIFFLILPSFIYAFLAGVWLMRTLADVAIARR
jgi:hypothetical protein